jgi:hypothetical protein
MPLMTWEGWIDDFEPWNADFDKEKDLFGFSYAQIDGIEGFWIKRSQRASLPWEQIEAMMESLQPLPE